jgi:hypothetical protein
VASLDPDNRESLTSVECISGSGFALPPMIIISGIIFLEKYFMNELSDDVLLATSKTGYMNDQLSLDWIHHFDAYTKQRQKGEWRMLIIGGHGSYLTIEFVSYCYENKITPFLLPAHSTHLLQPLDIGVFQSFKHHHQYVLEEQIRYGGLDYSKADFLAGFNEMRERTFRSIVIKDAFEKAGLIPFDPQKVLTKLIQFNDPERPADIPLIPYNYTNPATPPNNNHILEVLLPPPLNTSRNQG